MCTHHLDYQTAPCVSLLDPIFHRTPQTYFPGGSAKESAGSVGDLDLIPGLERSPGE